MGAERSRQKSCPRGMMRSSQRKMEQNKNGKENEGGRGVRAEQFGSGVRRSGARR